MKYKMTKAACKSKRTKEKGKRPFITNIPEVKNWADCITADYKIVNEDDESRSYDQNALVCQDIATYWLQAYPTPNRSTHETKNGD